MPRMYERVKLLRPIQLDCSGDVIGAGAEAIVVDLIDFDVVLLEFDLDRPDRVESTMATVYDFEVLPH